MSIKIGVYCIKLFVIAIGFTALFGCEVGPQQSISMRKHNSQKVECFGDRSLQAQVRTIGIVPQFTAEAIWTKWGPFLSEIGKNTNLCFQLYVERSIPSFEEQISNGKYDYAYINPIHQVMTKNNYIPLVKNGSSLLSGVIIVHPDSKIETIQDAEGKDLYLPAPNAFGASILVQQEFRELKININPIYVRTHPNVYLSVADDKEAVGGMILRTFEKEEAKNKRNVKILKQTKQYVPHPFSAHRSIPIHEQELVKSAILDLAKKPNLAILLENVQIPQPISANYVEDYMQLETVISSKSEPKN